VAAGLMADKVNRQAVRRGAMQVPDLANLRIRFQPNSNEVTPKIRSIGKFGGVP